MDLGLIASGVLVLGAVATVKLTQREAHAVANYVPAGRFVYVALAAALLAWDPGLAAIVMLTGVMARLRDTSYADRYRNRAKALASFDAPDSPAELGRATIRRLRKPITR
jgi:hypothetical protein